MSGKTIVLREPFIAHKIQGEMLPLVDHFSEHFLLAGVKSNANRMSRLAAVLGDHKHS